MARRSHLAARAVLAASVLGLALTAAPLAAGAEEAPASTPTLAQVLDGQVDGLTAEATTESSSSGGIGVVLEVTNHGDEPVAVAIPFGTLVVTDAESDQTLTVTPPPTDEVVEVAAAGGTPTIEVAPGSSAQHLPAYCTELGDGFTDGAPVTPIGDAHAVLADTLRTATAVEADGTATQDAVWWLTDEPLLPVSEQVAGLLEVDTAAFAADPFVVTPDTGYVPLWARTSDAGDLGSAPAYDDEEAAGILDESFEGPMATTGSDGGSVSTGPAIWLLLVGLVVVAGVVIAARSGRSAPAPVVARTAPGWYPDPWGGAGHRYWDGTTWTSRVLPPR